MSEVKEGQIHEEDLGRFLKREPITWMIGAICASTLLVGLETAFQGRLSRFAIGVVDKIGLSLLVIAVGLALYVTVKAVIDRRFARIVGAWGALVLMLVFEMVVCSALYVWSAFVDDDHFADGLKLPQGMVLSEPKPLTFDHDGREYDGVGDPVSPKKGDHAQIVLHDGTQGGLYHGEVWANPHEAGKLYLKAYEITEGEPLSDRALHDRSLMDAVFDDNENHLFLTKCQFTIYEGNWGQYYGARFELWFRPDSGNSERKLAEANYKIQGWQR